MLILVSFGAVRRGTEAALRASEKKYRELIDASPDAILVFDAHGKCVLSNASAARLRGCNEDELIGLSLADTYLPENAIGFEKDLAKRSSKASSDSKSVLAQEH